MSGRTPRPDGNPARGGRTEAPVNSTAPADSSLLRPIAFVMNCRSPVSTVEQCTFSDLVQMFREPTAGQKDGAAWLPADIEPGPRTAERVRAVSFLALDVEAAAEAVKTEAGEPMCDEHGAIIKRVTGPEPPAVDAMLAELALWGWRAFLHTSYSHTADHPRYRLVFDLCRPLLPAEVKPIGRHVAALLGLSDCFDAACLDPARLFYLPRCPEERRALFRHGVVDGDPLDVDVLLDEVRAIEAARRTARETRHGAQSASVIQAFNAAHPVAAVLEQHGYIPKGRQRWLRPGSTTGLAGVRLLPGADVERVYSSHDGDPLADDHAHDAFDVWRILAHGGDMKAAAREAAHLLGMNGKQSAGYLLPSTNDTGAKAAPEPLRRPVPPPTPYPIAELGPILRPAAESLRRVIQAPDAVCGASLLAAASLAVQALGDVENDGRFHPLSLFMLTVAASGERKSAVDSEALPAMLAYEKELTKEHVEAERAYQAAKAEYDARCKAVTAEHKSGIGLADALRAIGPAPLAPLVPFVRVQDFTAEGLAKLLALSRPSVGAFSDEAALVLGGHSMTKETVARTAATLCKLWDSGTLDRIRVLDGASKFYGRRFAMHLLAQPVIAEPALSDDVLSGQGFLARCLLSWPESTAGTRPYRAESLRNDPAMQGATQRLAELHRKPPPLAADSRQELEPPPLRLSAAAKAVWVRLHDGIEEQMRPGGKYATVQPWASKTPEQALRIAGVLTLLENDEANCIEAPVIERASELALWHLDEALRLCGVAELSPEIRNAESLLHWCHATGRELLHSSVALRLGPARIRERKTFTEAMSTLVAAGWALPIDGGAELDGRHRRHVWRIVPASEGG